MSHALGSSTVLLSLAHPVAPIGGFTLFVIVLEIDGTTRTLRDVLVLPGRERDDVVVAVLVEELRTVGDGPEK